MKCEIWIPFYLLPDKYLVSSRGLIKSLGRRERIKNGKTHTLTYSPRVLKCSDNGNGYLYFSIKFNGKIKHIYVHDAVYFSFNNIKKNGMDINHKDCNKKNNALENLELVTRKENVVHAVENGRCLNRKVSRGEEQGSSRFKEKDILYIRSQKGIKHARILAELFKTSKGHIYDIWAKRTWKWL